MNYETEPWYKLYIRESTEDKVLPVLNRALRDFLLRLAKSRDDATILGKTTNPGEDLARALGAHPSETETIVQFVGTMLEDGYLSHRKGRLWITNFVAAQASRSAGARRQKAYRDRHQTSHNEHSRPDNEPITEVVTVASHVTSQEIRSEKRREETKRDEPDARGGAATDPRAGWLARAIEKPRVPGAAPEPRQDPLDERISFRQWAISQQMLDWAKEKRLPDAKLDKALAELRDKVRGLHDVGFWDVKAIAFIEQAISWHAKPPGAAEHDRRTADSGQYIPSPETAALVGNIGRRL